MKYPNLFTPMKIGPVTIKNRLVMTGLETAELLMEQGNTVTIIKMADKIAPGAYPINASDVIGRLEKGGVRFLPGRKLKRIGDGIRYLRRKDSVLEEIQTDATVLAIGVRSNNTLEKECAGHFEQLYSIGNAVMPGRIGTPPATRLHAGPRITINPFTWI